VSNPAFLTLDEVLAIHADQIRRYGGKGGLRDLALLQSALGTTETTFDGDYLHTDLFEMAAAYLFHIVRNHPFVDGNKRTGLMVALVFLGLNDLELTVDAEELFELVSGVSTGKVAKAAVAVFLHQHSCDRDPSDS
jgi:death-on-curing protein